MNWKLKWILSQNWKFVDNKIDENWELSKLQESFKNWKFLITKSTQVMLIWNELKRAI